MSNIQQGQPLQLQGLSAGGQNIQLQGGSIVQQQQQQQSGGQSNLVS
ncbi:MAG: hypothetical protein GY696_20170, partial [Gammaproteobacteria bacterium]|nr:hypothetical protein [Gammaproteobacteria bacterium]